MEPTITVEAFARELTRARDRHGHARPDAVARRLRALAADSATLARIIDAIVECSPRGEEDARRERLERERHAAATALLKAIRDAYVVGLFTWLEPSGADTCILQADLDSAARTLADAAELHRLSDGRRAPGAERRARLVALVFLALARRDRSLVARIMRSKGDAKWTKYADDAYKARAKGGPSPKAPALPARRPLLPPWFYAVCTVALELARAPALPQGHRERRAIVIEALGAMFPKPERRPVLRPELR